MPVVVVYHPQLEPLAQVVTHLRSLGIPTRHGTSADTLLESIEIDQVSVLIIPERVLGRETKQAVDSLTTVLTQSTVIRMPETENLAASNMQGVLVSLGNAVTTALAADVRAPVSQPSIELRGDLHEVGLADLLQLLSLGKKTGTLLLSFTQAAGEIRFVDGDIVDSTYRRAEGMKAMVRLLLEREGAFQFLPSQQITFRRIRESFPVLMLDAIRQTDEMRRIRTTLGLAEGASIALQVTDNTVVPEVLTSRASMHQSGSHLRRAFGDVLQVLQVPMSLEDLLDSLPVSDLEMLIVLERLDELGHLRRVPIGELRPSLAGPEGLVVLRGLIRRLRPLGFRGGCRIVFAGTSQDIRSVRHALPQLAEAISPNEPALEFGGDRPIEVTTTLGLGEAIDLDIVTVIDDPWIAPMLPLFLIGSVGIITISAPSQELREIVEFNESPLMDVETLAMHSELSAIDLDSPATLATLIRSAIEWIGAS